jgi:hypothetical protein
MSRLAKTVFRILMAWITAFTALTGCLLLHARSAEVHRHPRTKPPTSRTALASHPIYLQTDPRWAKEKVGGSGESIRKVGCTVCCLSMALAQHGIRLNPAELNRKLKEADGYTQRGLVKWDAVARISHGKVRVNIPKNPSHDKIQNALSAGNPVLVRLLMPSGRKHWGLLVGRRGHDYLMKNPKGNGKTLETVSSFSNRIIAIRIIEKVTG